MSPSTYSRSTLTAHAARSAIAGAVVKAEELGLAMCIAVTDDVGDLTSFLRMDGAAKLAVDIAQNKAYTAATFGMATHEWWDFIKDDPPLLHGITHTPRLITYGGGFPIRLVDGLVGAIGVSGGHYSQDMEVARAGLVSVGAGPE